VQPSAAEFEEIKRRTEAIWAGASIHPGIAGFQIQPGTRWNPGLARDEIDTYERALGVRFPASFRCMLVVMNGTDLPTINVYGSRGHPAREGVGVYAYPRDLALVRERVAWVAEDRGGITEVLAEQGFRLEPDTALVPVYAHRYLVCGPDPLDGPVLSIMDADAIAYGRTLVEYLHSEFFKPIP
jgi:hypothetical protein